MADSDVDELPAMRPAAIAEARRLCPELLRTDLARPDDGQWLDVLTWSTPDGEERLPAMGDLHRFDRCKTPAARWSELQDRFLELLDVG